MTLVGDVRAGDQTQEGLEVESASVAEIISVTLCSALWTRNEGIHLDYQSRHQDFQSSVRSPEAAGSTAACRHLQQVEELEKEMSEVRTLEG